MIHESTSLLDLTRNKKISWLAASAVFTILTLFFLSIFGLKTVIQQKDDLALDHSEQLLDVERLFLAAEKQVSSSRGYLLFKSQEMLENLDEARKEFDEYIQQLYLEVTSLAGKDFLEKIILKNQEYQGVVNKLLQMRARNGLSDIEAIFAEELAPKRDELFKILLDFEQHKKNKLERLRLESVNYANRIWMFTLILGFIACLIIPLLAYLLYQAVTQHQRAVAAVKLRQEVLAAVSHDLKNPLNTIIMGAGILEKKAQSDEFGLLTKNLADKMLKSGRMMQVLIEDLLSLAKIESGHLQINKQSFSPRQLAQEAWNMLQVLSSEKSLHTHMDYTADEQALQGDFHQLLRVLSNFIGNAIKFTPEQGKVSLRVESQHQRIIFSVIDTGKGIPENEIHHVFDRFWQSKATVHQGTGLGLSIAKGIIEAHDGEIWATSKIGEGSTFSFALTR